MKALLLFVFIATTAFSQNYTSINVQQNNFYTSNNNAGLMSIAGSINAWRNSWENKNLRTEAVSKAQSQMNMTRNQYDEATSYPEKITDGWHLVVATDNYNYCAPAKVYIEDNKVARFVPDNYFGWECPIETIGPIKKGKCKLNIKFAEGHDVVDVYFLNDLEESTIVPAPQHAGYITFWSDWKKSESIKIWIEKQYVGQLGKQNKLAPECGSQDTKTFMFKPGVYRFKAAGRGTIAWEGTFTIKEGMCNSFVLNENNAKN